MNKLKNNTLLISGAVVVKKAQNGRKYWFLVRQSEDEGWEIPKVVVRKGESSVRASIRMTGEQGGITAQALEEAGRSGGSTTLNGKVVPRRSIYYLMLFKASGEILGFLEHGWFEYASARKKISTKTEKDMLKQANQEYGKWLKEQEKIRKGIV